MTNEVAVSVLDLVGMRTGESASSAIGRSVDLARHVEQWGYKRYWLAEHPSISRIACSATPVLVGHVAGGLKTDRVGIGGGKPPDPPPLALGGDRRTPHAPLYDRRS